MLRRYEWHTMETETSRRSIQAVYTDVYSVCMEVHHVENVYKRKLIIWGWRGEICEGWDEGERSEIQD